MRALTKRGTPRRREYTANPVKRSMTPAQRIKHHTNTAVLVLTLLGVPTVLNTT